MSAINVLSKSNGNNWRVWWMHLPHWDSLTNAEFDFIMQHFFVKKKSPQQKSDVIYSHCTYMTLVIIKRCRFRTYFLSLNMAQLRFTKVVNGDHIEVNIIHLGISIRLIFSLKRVNKWIWSWIPGSWSKGSDYGKTFWSKQRKPSLKEVMFDLICSVTFQPHHVG